MDAELEKRRLGAQTVKTCLYGQYRETDNATLLHSISESVMDVDGLATEQTIEAEEGTAADTVVA